MRVLLDSNEYEFLYLIQQQRDYYVTFLLYAFAVKMHSAFG